jgi:thioesterase DpgC
MPSAEILQSLASVGLPEGDITAWAHSEPPQFSVRDARRSAKGWSPYEVYIRLGTNLLDRLPMRSARGEAEQMAADLITSRLRQKRTEFLRSNAELVYGALTSGYSRIIRAQELVERSADQYPGLTPEAELMSREASLPLKEKSGHEIDQGLFLWQILSDQRAGAHLVHSMLRPTSDASNLLDVFRRTGHVDLDLATVSRQGNIGIVEHRNTTYLNAEDDDTNRALEIAIDLVILDPACDAGVLRGGLVTHPKFAGRRVFNAGLNLTRLYKGELPFLFYMTRDLGLVNKIYRGHTPEDFRPAEGETGLEKPWIAVVEAFAIGGGCQLLLVMDYVLAERGAFFNLPARKEGIIPGAANLRLPRFVGDRMARRGIMFDERFEAESPEGRLLCDEIVPSDEMDAAISRVTQSLSSSGVVSAAGNRKAIRVAQEPLSVFQAYMATYAREQAFCHLSPALVRNLEQYWLSRTSSS